MDRRLAQLLALREAIARRGKIGAFDGVESMGPEERRLLQSLPQIVEMLDELSEPDREHVCSVVVTLTTGMEYDLTKFPAEDSARVGSVESFDELDRYTYLVAGCVGQFWTAITMAHSRALSSWDPERMSDLGVRFGKALQLTNVLRDVPRDLRIGRCYLPREVLERAGVEPDELLYPSSAARARPALIEGVTCALDHFRAAEAYLLAIPRHCVRLRLAVLWPLLMGLATLGVLARNEDWLDPAHPSKVSRGWVYRTLFLSAKVVMSNSLLQFWIGRLHRDVERALDTGRTRL